MDDLTRGRYAALADHLAVRRDDILADWHRVVRADPLLSTPTSLTAHQLDDHIPAILDGYVAVVRGGPGELDPTATAGQQAGLAEHGVFRWRQGYQLREVVREWGHLQLCVLDELDRYAADPDPGVMAFARRELAALVRDGVSKSAAEYFELHRLEAAGHVRDLGAALNQVKAMQGQRAEALREAAHDLRGHLGATATAAAGLALEHLPDASRVRFAKVLQRGLSSLHAMLNDLMGLARLEAGQDRPEFAPFDAATVLKELCETTAAAAEAKGLALRVEGPEELWVTGDAGKVRRIVQNLLLNALKYTREGGVTVRWAAGGPDDPERWVLAVADTGPGFHTGSAVPMAAALTADPADAAGVSAPPAERPGEGIGLSIVKRLCELLDATLELESAPGVGSTFRVRFPVKYG